MNIPNQNSLSAATAGAGESNRLAGSIRSYVSDPSQNEAHSLTQALREARAARLAVVDLSNQLTNSDYRSQGRKDRLCIQFSRLLATELLADNQALVSLSFSGCYLSRESRAVILNALADGANNLETLAMDLQSFPSRMGMSPNEVIALQRVIRNCPKLSQVKLEAQPLEVSDRLASAVHASGASVQLYVADKLLEHSQMDEISLGSLLSSVDMLISEEDLLSLITEPELESVNDSVSCKSADDSGQADDNLRIGPLAFMDEDDSVGAEFRDQTDPLQCYNEAPPVLEVAIKQPPVREVQSKHLDPALEVELDALTCYSELLVMRSQFNRPGCV